MKKVTIIVILLAIPSFCFAQNTVIQTKPKYPLQLTIKSDKQMYEVGEEIRIEMVLKNRSKKEILCASQCMFQRPYYPFRIETNGLQQPVTFHYFSGGRFIGPNFADCKPIVLSSGRELVLKGVWKRYTYSRRADGFWLTLPEVKKGNYKIQGIFDQAQSDSEELWAGILTSNTITVEVVEKKSEQPLQPALTTDKFKNEVVEAVLRKVVEDYEQEKISYGDKMPTKMSIALVVQQYNSRHLNGYDNVEKHWVYEKGDILDSEPSVRKEMFRDKTYSIVTFAIFTEGNKTTVQLDEQWFGQNGYGFLYEVFRESDGKISLRKSMLLWIS